MRTALSLSDTLYEQVEKTASYLESTEKRKRAFFSATLMWYLRNEMRKYRGQQ
jgi:hypothetical protein